MIDSFSGKYRFLSNFWLVPVRNTFEPWDTTLYDSVEHAFQAAKTTDKEMRLKMAWIKSPADVKAFTRTDEFKPYFRTDIDWNILRLNIMFGLLEYKFQMSKLGSKLVDTQNEILIEGNHWHDNFWGSCSCVLCDGKMKHNALGQMLMNIRLRRQVEIGMWIP